MSKYYYNGVLLPQLPQDKIRDYPYCFIRYNTYQGYYNLVMSQDKCYLDSNKLDGNKYPMMHIGTSEMYRIPISSYDEYDEWTYWQNASGYFSINDTNLVLHWTNVDIPNGSATSTDIYLKASEPIPETPTATVKFLIQNEDKYYTVVDSALSEISIAELNAQAFQDYGFDKLPDGTLLTTLPHPKLLYWQDSEEELPNITAKVTATPNGQYISKVIDLSNASIIGIKAVTVECTGTPWFSCSFDGGETWKKYSGGAWVDVVSYGMTEETIEAITSDEWNTAVSGIDSFVMRVLLRSPADSLTNLSVNFLNKTT